MAKLKTLLVQTAFENGALVPFSSAHHALDICRDPDNALERVSAYFLTNWSAEVHALRWIFPEDLLLLAQDRSPFLVLHVDKPARLSSVLRQNRQTYSAECSPADDERILAAATRPSPLEPWSEPRWLKRIEDWVLAHFGRNEAKRISQVRVCTNGAVLKIETIQSSYYMKTLPAFLSYEPRLLRFLEQKIPGMCPAVLSISPDSATHVTQGIKGSPLRVIDDSAQWKAILKEVAEFQIQTIPHVETMRSFGLPSQNLRTLAGKLKEILEGLIALQKEAPGALSERELDKFPMLVRKAAQDCERLGECGIPEALVHGDLSESNAFRTTAGTTSLIDWTFSRIAHPFFVLGFTLFAAAEPQHRLHKSWTELRDAYVAPWGDYAPSHILLAGLESASRLFWIDAAQVIGRLLLQIKGEMPGSTVHLPAVLRRLLSAFDLGGSAA